MKRSRSHSLLLLVFAVLTLCAKAQDDAGGGFEESMFETVENEAADATEPATSSSSAAADAAWDINDSLYHIPAFDTYCLWDTKNIHAYDFDYRELTDTVQIVMRLDSCDFAHPFRGRITSNFGERGARYHYGIDVKLYRGDPVKVAFEGMVRIARYSPSYGNVVVVRHPNGLETLYAHLSARKVKPGDYVQAGEVIGLGGNTGRSTGSHLHFECRYKGEPLDPNSIIDWETGTLLVDSLDLHKGHFAYLKEARSRKYYTIRRGDSLSGIARKHGTSVRTLCRLNGISANGTIYAGRRLRVR